MLPPLTRVALSIRKRRQLLKLTQRKVAAALGCNQSYLAQVETARRPISRAVAQRLEILLKVRPGSYTRGIVFRRGRPKLTPATRQALRAIRRAEGLEPRPLAVKGRPHHPRPDRAHGLNNPFWPIAMHLGPRAAEEVRQLEKLRCNDERFWTHLNSIPYDSWSEKRLQVRMGLTGADMAGVSTGNLKCVLPSAHGKTGRDTSRSAYPAYVWQREEVSIALFPQRCVGTYRTHRWPDNIVVAAHQGRRVTAVVEVDGKPYHQDEENGKKRDDELGVPILHLDAAELGEPGLIEKISRWTRSLFE